MNYVYFEKEDFDKNRLYAAAGCLLFPIPLLLCPHSKLGRFCANQGLLLLIAYVALKIVFAIINALLGWVPLIGPLVAFCGWLALTAVIAVALYLAWKVYKRQPVLLIKGIDLIH